MSTRSIIGLIAALLRCQWGCSFAADNDTTAMKLSRHDLDVSTAPAHLGVFDCNHDGLPDLLVTDMNEGRLYVLLGSEDGEFNKSSESPFPAGHHPGELAVADFNADGHADCAIANHDIEYVTVLLGDSTGAFAPAPASPLTVASDPHPHTIRAASINSDNRIDLIIDSPNDHALIILYGDGAGRFTAADSLVPVGGRPYHTVAAGEVNLDGCTDLITPNQDAISVLLGDGQGAFVHADGSPFPAADPFSVAIGDVNGDGCDDICCTHYHSNNVTIILGGEEIHPPDVSPVVVGEAPYGIIVADVYGNTNAEIIIGHYETGMITILSVEQ